ncbi:MAG: GAF domain-containing sensor histidine kinase [Gemmatimonadetes bacterium]|nr:GAF domain-containing sensor histidine kinase [Gemmatimonadota bacterium]
MNPASTPTPPPAQALAVRLERLVAAVPGLIAELSLEGVLQRVADLAAELLDARYAAVGMLNPDGRTLASFTTTGMTGEERERIGPHPRGHGILGLVIHKGQVVRLADLTAHPARYGFPAHHPVMRPFLGVPIIGKRGVLGDLYLTEKVGGAEFTAEDEHIATLLAAKAAAAIENARLHEESARLLEEVQQLHRSRERFFAMVNHELRNSLAAVFGWAEMLVRRKEPGSVPRAAFEVLDSAEQAISLINDLLDLSRLDEDRLKPVIREVDCGGVVRQALSRVTPAADGKRVRLQADLPAEPPACRTDPHRVEQILVNLLTNAIRHTPEGSVVRAAVEPLGGDVVFRIEDQGPGVPLDDLDRIFDIYQTKAEEGKGSGLGLPSVVGWPGCWEASSGPKRIRPGAAASSCSSPPYRCRIKTSS